MASEINDLTNKPTPLSTDEVELQATEGGASAKATVANLAKGMSYNDLNDKPTIPTGDVTSSASITDNAVVRGDGGSKGVQGSDVTIDDSANLTLSPAVPAPGTGVLTALAVGTNEITERTGGSGVTVDGVLIKDGEVDGRDVSADGGKLDNIEANADVTDTANVTAAGALMDSEVDADIKTLSLPANTTISTFGASLIDDAAASNARTTLGLGTLSTLSSVNNSNWSGTDLSVANGGTGASTATNARTNLGVAIGSDVQAYNANLTTWAGKTAPSGTPVGTTDTQTLTNKTIDGSQLVDNSVSDVKIKSTVAFSVRSTSQTISNATFTKIDFDTEDFDEGGNFDISTNTFTAPYAGIYHFDAYEMLPNAGSGTVVYIYFYKNGSVVDRLRYVETASNYEASMQVSATMKLAASDTVNVYMYQNSGGNLSTSGGADSGFSGHLVGGV